MCKLCDEGRPQDHTGSLRDSRRDFLKVAATTGVAAAVQAARPHADGDGPSLEYERTFGARRRRTFKMSRIAAPLGEVTMPIRFGNFGNSRAVSVAVWHFHCVGCRRSRSAVHESCLLMEGEGA